MRLLILLFALVASPLLMVGCAATHTPAAASGQPHAECVVCKHNADLACIDVEVDAKTPKCEYGGKTYYFCSEHCCKKFKSAPAKFMHE